MVEKTTEKMYPEITKTFDVHPDDPFMIKPKENGGSKIRLNEINRIRNRLERDVDTRKKLTKGYKKFYNILQSVSIGTSSIAAALSGATIGMLANPGVVLPLAVTNVTLGTVGTVSGVWSKSVNKRVKKHQRLSLLASNTLSTVNELLSESLRDNHVSDREFKRVLDVHQQYLLECKFVNDTFSKKNLVEKDEIKRKIDDALSDK